MITTTIIGLIAAILVALPFIGVETYALHLIIVILIWAFAYTGWSVMGRFGLVSLGHGAFMSIGGYVTALLWNKLCILCVHNLTFQDPNLVG